MGRTRRSVRPGVQQALGGELAYNAVQTTLVRLHEKGLLTGGAAGRAHTYASAPRRLVAVARPTRAS